MSLGTLDGPQDLSGVTLKIRNHDSDETQNHNSNGTQKHESNGKRNHDLNERRNHDLNEKRNHDLNEKRNHDFNERRNHDLNEKRNHDLNEKRNHDSNGKRNHDFNEKLNHDMNERRNHDLNEKLNHDSNGTGNHDLDETQNLDLSGVYLTETPEQQCSTLRDEEHEVLLYKSTSAEQTESSLDPTPDNKAEPCWAWVVLCGCFINNMLMIGYIKSFGIMFVEFQEAFQESASMTTLVLGVQQAVFSVTSIFTLNILIEKVSIRKLTVAGSILTSVGAVLSGFASNVGFLIFTHGCLFGLGFALVYGPGTVLLTRYFEKHFRIATAVANCSTSIGCMLMPPLFTYLLEEYSRHGTMMLIGAILLQGVIASSLFRPLSKKGQVETSEGSHDVTSCDTHNGNDVKRYSQVNEYDPTHDVTLCTAHNGNDAKLFSQANDVTVNYDVGTYMGVNKHDGIHNSNDVTRYSNINEYDVTHDVTYTPVIDNDGTHCGLDETLSTSVNEYNCKDDIKLSSQIGEKDGKILEDNTNNIMTNNVRNSLKSRCSAHCDHQNKTNSSMPLLYHSTIQRNQADILPSNPHHKSETSLCITSSTNCPRLRGFSNTRTPGLNPALAQNELSSLPNLQETDNTNTIKHSVSNTELLKNTNEATPMVFNTSQSETIDTNRVSNNNKYANTSNASPDIMKPKQNMVNRFFKTIDIALFKKPRFLIIFCFTSCGIVGYSMFGLFLPPLVEEKGLTQVQASILLTIIAGCDLCSRLLSGVIAEMKWVKPNLLLGTVLLVLGVTYQFIRLYSSFQHLLVFVVVFGCLGGSYSTLHPIIVLDFLGVSQFPKAFGFVQVFHGASQSMTYPLLGALRDVTGTYNTCYYYMGGTLLLGAVSLFLEPLVRRNRDKQTT